MLITLVNILASALAIVSILLWIMKFGVRMGFQFKTKAAPANTDALDDPTVSDDGDLVEILSEEPVASAPAAQTSKVRTFLNSFLTDRNPYVSEKASRRQLLNIFLFALGVRAVIYLLGVVIACINSEASAFTFNDFVNLWNHWDSAHYVALARDGYMNAGVNEGRHLFLVFFPLYPWLIRAFHLIIPNWNIAGMAVSVIAFAVGCTYLYATACEEYSERIAFRAILLLCFHPFSFFFGTVMTESLFLCTMAMGFYYIRRHKWLVVGILGLFCSLTRVQGAILMGVAGVEFLETYPFITMYREKRIGEFFRAVFTKGVFLLITLFGPAIYFFLNYKVEGDPFRFMEYEVTHWYHNRVGLVKCIDELARLSFADSYSLTYRMSAFLPSLLSALIGLALTLCALRRHSLKYTAYLIVYTLLCYSVSWVISGGRYMMCALPLYFVLGEWGERHQRAYKVLLAVSAALLTIYLMGYQTWHQVL